MRPPIQRQSALLAPLNDILGTEGTVRLLRVLCASRMPMSAGALAESARLERSSARRSLGVLLDTGIADVQGRAKAPHYALRREHPLAPAIVALFRAERERAEAVLSGIQDAVRRLSPAPKAVWLEGAVATETDEPGEPLGVRVVGSSGDLQRSVMQLRETLAPLERELDVTINVIGTTPADLASHRETGRAWEDRLRTARSLVGLPPAAFLPPEHHPRSRVRTHVDHDTRALIVATEIAKRLKHDPALIDRALDFVEDRLAEASPRERQELDEWRQLLRTASPMRIRRFLVDMGERATRLRQTLPFLGVLSPAERNALLEAAVEQGRGTTDDV